MADDLSSCELKIAATYVSSNDWIWSKWRATPWRPLRGAMGFWRLAVMLEDEGLGRVIARKTSRASGIVRQPYAQHRLGSLKKLPCLFEKAGCFRGQRSSPSSLISCMSGERSR